MGWEKTDVEGRVTFQSPDGERLRNPGERPADKYGWQKVDVDGKIMWQSPDGTERVFEL